MLLRWERAVEEMLTARSLRSLDMRDIPAADLCRGGRVPLGLLEKQRFC